MADKAKEIIYVPILKTKAGDRWALSHLKPATRRRVRPLLEVHPHQSKSDAEHIPSICEDLAADWGTDRRFYLDGVWLHGESGNAGTLGAMFTSTEAFGLSAIPVVRPSFNDSSLAQVAAIVEETGRGYLLRMQPKTPSATVNAVVAAVGVPRNKVDLMIDYGSRGMSLAADLPIIPHINDWRRLIAASGTFPSSLQPIGLGNWTFIPRHCWRTYSAALAGGGLPRTPLFSDYTMRDPGCPPAFGVSSVNLRYTVDQDWLAKLGGKVKDGAAAEMHDFCAELIARPEYRGPAFSDGDAEIQRVADPDEGTGNAGQWIQWGANHHVELVINQLGGP